MTSNRLSRDSPLAYFSFSLIGANKAEVGLVVTQSRGKDPLPAIPAKSGIQHRKRALRAPLQEWPMIGRSGPSGAAMCAFRALFALDSRLRGNGRNFVHGASFLATNGAAFLPFDCVTAWSPGLVPP